MKLQTVDSDYVTCADSADVVEQLVDSFASKGLQFMKGLQGQQSPVAKSQRLQI